jgi:hypothetical protein
MLRSRLQLNRAHNCCEKQKTKLVGHYLLGAFYLGSYVRPSCISSLSSECVSYLLGLVPLLSIYQSYQHMGSISHLSWQRVL